MGWAHHQATVGGSSSGKTASVVELGANAPAPSSLRVLPGQCPFPLSQDWALLPKLRNVGSSWLVHSQDRLILQRSSRQCCGQATPRCANQLDCFIAKRALCYQPAQLSHLTEGDPRPKMGKESFRATCCRLQSRGRASRSKETRQVSRPLGNTEGNSRRGSMRTAEGDHVADQGHVPELFLLCSWQ